MIWGLTKPFYKKDWAQVRSFFDFIIPSLYYREGGDLNFDIQKSSFPTVTSIQFWLLQNHSVTFSLSQSVISILFSRKAKITQSPCVYIFFSFPRRRESQPHLQLYHNNFDTILIPSESLSNLIIFNIIHSKINNR